VMQIHVRCGVNELEEHAARQLLAPKEVVIPTKRWTKGVRILSLRCIRPEVERDVNIFS